MIERERVIREYDGGTRRLIALFVWTDGYDHRGALFFQEQRWQAPRAGAERRWVTTRSTPMFDLSDIPAIIAILQDEWQAHQGTVLPPGREREGQR